MKKKTPIWLVASAAGLAASAAVAGTLTVMVSSTAIRQRPAFYAPAVATAKLGDKLDADGPAENGWYSVTAGDTTGYIHQSAVTTKSLNLAARTEGGGATTEELALAGKGFNEQVEQSYKSANPKLDFTKVDAMLKRHLSDAKILAFMKAGGLIPETAQGQGGDP